LGFHPRAEQLLALFAAGTRPDVVGQALTQLAAKVEVLEQKGVRFVYLLHVAHILRLGPLGHHHFEIHDAPCLAFLRVEGPHGIFGVRQQTPLTFAHLQLERFADEVQKT